MEAVNEDEILKKLNNIQGLQYCKDDILRYAKYIKLYKDGKIKDIGNANIIINCDEDYTDRKALVELLIEIFDTNNVHYLQIRELKNDLFFNKINRDVELFILDAIELQTTLKFNIADLKYRVNSNADKVFIIINGDFNAKEMEYLENNFFWYFGIMKPTIEDMKLYIVNKLKDNGILISKNCNAISELANEDISVIDTTLVDLIIDVKLSNGDVSTVIDNKILNQYYHNEDTKQDVNNAPNTKSGMEQLDELIGLEPIKQQIKQIVNYVTTAKCRHQDIMLHMVLMGNSGCGKNEVAKVIGKIYKEQGILSKGEFIEVSRSDLVAGYVGQSALKTKAILEKAKGSILYIDECYSLDGSTSEKDFSHEVIAEIIKFMEDKRNDICIIFGGYIKETERLLESNRGFNSRIPFKLYFDDYTSEELYQIFKKMAKASNYKLSNNIKPILLDHFEKARQKEDFGNGRYVRNILDKVAMEQAQRVAQDITEDKDLIRRCDVRNVLDSLKSAEPVKRQIGFTI